MGFATFRAHKAQAAKSKAAITKRAPPTPNANCTTGGFYKSPSNGATIDSLKPLLISWDPSCLPSQKLDIHLLAPWFNGATTEITSWTGVTNADGQKTVNVEPRWWNSTSEVKVQLAIVQAGLPPAMTTLPAGPIFTATYTAPADGSTPPSASLDPSSSSSSSDSDGTLAGTSKSLSPGSTAAAVLIPLLFVGLAIFAYLRYHRRKASTKSQRFSQALDKRMSTISADWKSMSAAGAHAAIRSSMALGSGTGNRESAAFSFGGIRPSMDGASASANGGSGAPQMKQVRTGTGVGLRHPGGAAFVAAERASRVSRVSFADTLTPGRPSTDSRRTRTGLQSIYNVHNESVPPVPVRKDVVSGVPSVYPDSEIERRVGGDSDSDGDSDGDGEEGKRVGPSTIHALSPRQTSGPLTLTPEDIHARIQGRLSPAQEKNEEYDEVMPALSLMRMSATEDNYYLLPQPPQPTHTHTHASPLTPSLSAFPSAFPSALPSPSQSPGSPLPPYPYSATSSTSGFTLSAYTHPAAPGTPPAPTAPLPVLTPDDMLRAYAVRTPPPSAFPSSLSVPSSFASSASMPSSASPKTKGRKLSIRASFGLLGRKERERAGSPMGGERTMGISYPVAETFVHRAGAGAGAGVGPTSPGAGAGVGVGVGGEAGMAGVGARKAARYVPREHEHGDGEVDYEGAYGGVGRAN